MGTADRNRDQETSCCSRRLSGWAVTDISLILGTGSVKRNRHHVPSITDKEVQEMMGADTMGEVLRPLYRASGVVDRCWSGWVSQPCGAGAQSETSSNEGPTGCGGVTGLGV